MTLRLQTGLWLCRAGLLSLLVLAASSEQSLAEAIRFDTLTIPAVINNNTGGSGPVELEAIIIRPDDQQPHPLAILNHGSPRQPSDRPSMTPYGMSAQANAFAQRGWVAVAFMRRGYGRSQGGWAEGYGSCGRPNYIKAGEAGAADIAGVARYMQTQPYVSKGKWISVGVSAGGFATVALAAEAPPGLAAAISFAPGRGSLSPDSVCGESQLIAAFTNFGRTSRIPLLWVSADNDHFFGPRLVTQLAGAFSGAGGTVSLIRTPPFGEDGHHLFSAAGSSIWAPIVDRFLAANKLVFRDRPIEVTTQDLAPPAGLNQRGREAFKAYLDSGPNKAFAVGQDSHFGWATGRPTIERAREDAIGLCTPSAAGKCGIVNVNNKPAN